MNWSSVYKNRLLPNICAFIMFLTPSYVDAFAHLVREGETLASISKSMYGRPDYEFILVSANALDAYGGSVITPGTRLEIPSLRYHRISIGDSWPKLAEQWLGNSSYAPILAHVNHTQAWLVPDAGSVFIVPYVLRFIASNEEGIFDMADRFLGDKMLAWQITILNDTKRTSVRRGDVTLIPLSNLTLTSLGESEAAAEEQQHAHLKEFRKAREKQHELESEIPKLWSLVHKGKYVETVRLGERLRTFGEATRSQTARIAKALTTAYVALDATGAAIEACQLYQKNANTIHLEPETTSPKIRAICAH